MAPLKSAVNPFDQVGMAVFKIWGLDTNYLNQLKNEVIPLVSELNNID